MIWCNIMGVRLGLTRFVFVVVWCLLVLCDVIFTFFSSNGCFLAWLGCDLVLSDLV